MSILSEYRSLAPRIVQRVCRKKCIISQNTSLQLVMLIYGGPKSIERNENTRCYVLIIRERARLCELCYIHILWKKSV